MKKAAARSAVSFVTAGMRLSLRFRMRTKLTAGRSCAGAASSMRPKGKVARAVGGKVVVEEVYSAVFVDRNVFQVCVRVSNRRINCRLALRVQTKRLCKAAVFSSKNSSIWKESNEVILNWP